MTTYLGTPGNDPGGFGYNILYGFAGNDELQMSFAGYGEVYGGAGDDIVYMHPYTPESYGKVFGGDGNDLAFGGILEDSVFGEAGDDSLGGRAGNDQLFGGAGRDAMAGDAGDDWIYGGKGDDAGTITVPGSSNPVGPPVYMDVEAGLFGGIGADHLYGGGGGDALYGGDDSDVLVGGGGRDLLWGGLGSDSFEFDTLKQSKPGKAKHDTIFDFEAGDRIDLRLIDANTHRAGDQHFKFIGDHHFSDKAGELRYAGGMVKGDVNGDGHADFAVAVFDSPALAKGDFLL